MEDILASFDKKLVANTVTAMVGAFLGVWVPAFFSLRRFRSQKWWETKALAYQDATRSLSSLLRLHDESLNDAMLKRDRSSPEQKEASQEFIQHRKNLTNLRHESALLFSQDAQDVLDQYFSAVERMPRHNTFEEYSDEMCHLTRKSLTKFTLHAKRDLKVQ